MSLTAPPDNRSPPQPRYVLRGHIAQIHSLCFLRQNTRLLTGDADGWVVLWDVATKRPVAVWRAHTLSVLGLDTWGPDSIITHGRDNKLCVWKLSPADEDGLNQTLPVDDPVTDRKAPWLLHSLLVNALNFCPFAKCHESTEDNLLVAVPGIKEGDVAIYSLPSEAMHSYIKFPATSKEKTGMIMSLKLFSTSSLSLTLIAGYETGATSLWRYSSSTQWTREGNDNVHSQPVLSVDLTPTCNAYFSSSADAKLARHHILQAKGQVDVDCITDTKHAGQQSLRVRSDGRILATAGWDGRIRVYSATSLQELAVLKWHKQGCYALAFADLIPQSEIQASDSSRQLSIRQTRTAQEYSTHWLAAGSKDGKVSLWDIY